MQYDTETPEEERAMIIRYVELETVGGLPLPHTERNALMVRMDCQKLFEFLDANARNEVALSMLSDTKNLYADMRSSLDETSLEIRVSSTELDIDNTRDQVREQKRQGWEAIANIEARFDNLTNVVNVFGQAVQSQFNAVSSTVTVVQSEVVALSSTVTVVQIEFRDFRQAVQSQFNALSSTVTVVQSEFRDFRQAVQREVGVITNVLNEILVQMRNQ